MLSRLSDREREVVPLIVEGMSNKEIARQLNMSETAVKMHLRRIYRKLAINNRTKLAVLAAQRRDWFIAPPSAHRSRAAFPRAPIGAAKLGHSVESPRLSGRPRCG